MTNTAPKIVSKPTDYIDPSAQSTYAGKRQAIDDRNYKNLVSEPKGVQWFWWVLFVIVLFPLAPITLPYLFFLDQAKKNRAAMYYSAMMAAKESK